MPLPEACVPHAEGSESALGPMSVGHFGEIAGHFGGKQQFATKGSLLTTFIISTQESTTPNDYFCSLIKNKPYVAKILRMDTESLGLGDKPFPAPRTQVHTSGRAPHIDA